MAAQLAWTSDNDTLSRSKEPQRAANVSRLPRADEDCALRGGAPSTDQVVTRSILDSWEVVTYGLEEGNDWRAIMLAPNPQGGTDFVAVRQPLISSCTSGWAHSQSQHYTVYNAVYRTFLQADCRYKAPFTPSSP